MSYIVLARRTRPQSLNELVGQDSIRDALKGMLETNKVPHAFLFTGTRGTGKTSSARILAKSLNCAQGPTASPCQTCRHCIQISACSHEDVLEIDGASHTGVDNIRDLRESARFYPISARYKIFVIDEVHMLSSGAFNALLKTLEEPPPQVVFILATTELHKIPITIRSRCVTFSFKKIDYSVIFEHLQKILQAENVRFEKDALKLIAREAKGSLRDSLSLLEQALALRSDKNLTVVGTRQSLGLQNEESAFQIFLGICQKNHGEVLSILQKSDNAGLDLSILMESVANYFRFSLILKSTADLKESNVCAYLLQEERAAIERATEPMNPVALSEIFKILSASVKDMQRSAHALGWAEIVVIDAMHRAEWISASEMIAHLQNHDFTKSVQNIQNGQNVQMRLVPAIKSRDDISKSRDDISKSRNDISKSGESRTLTEGQGSIKSVESRGKETIADTNNIDMSLYKQFIAIATKKSPILGARLGFVQLESFNQNSICFADTPENATYLSFDPKDQQYFWESLEEVGLKTPIIKGANSPEIRISLNGIQEAEKKKDLAIKEKEILARESVKNLMLLTKEIKLTPIEN